MATPTTTPAKLSMEHTEKQKNGTEFHESIQEIVNSNKRRLNEATSAQYHSLAMDPSPQPEQEKGDTTHH
jgi:hypothetical protein